PHSPNSREAPNNAQAWLPKNSSPALDAIPKPYYCGTKNHTPAPSLLRRHCLALHPPALPVHSPPTTAKASALASLMSGVANRKVTSKRRTTPFRSPREAEPAESNHHRVQTGYAQ